MTKWNAKKTISEKISEHPDLTVNEEGGVAFKAYYKMDLMIRTISALISEDGFYKSGSELNDELRNSIAAVASRDPKFILKLAKYARKELYLRSAPVVLTGEFALNGCGAKVPGASHSIAEVISRADEITELIAYVITQNKFRKIYKGKIPMVVKNGVAEALNKFDAYAFAKYSRDTDVTFRDAIFMSHPKAKDEEQLDLFGKIINGTLEPPETWEVIISTEGSNKESWTKASKVLPYMACLRNLRNLIEHGVDMKPVLAKIRNPEAVRKSKQFPYRFYSAYKELEHVSGSSNALDALSDAIDLSIANVPEFKGVTLTSCDISGSMSSTVSGKSKLTCKEAGCIFGAIVSKKSENAIASAFAENFKVVNLSRRDSLFTNAEKLMRVNPGNCSTNAYKIMDYLVDNKVFVDRIILFSDMQCYDDKSVRAARNHLWNASGGDDTNVYAGLMKYRKKVNPNVFMYTFDLANYGTLQIPKNDPRTCIAGGFSEKILNLIPAFEKSRTDMLKEIEDIKI